MRIDGYVFLICIPTLVAHNGFVLITSQRMFVVRGLRSLPGGAGSLSASVFSVGLLVEWAYFLNRKVDPATLSNVFVERCSASNSVLRTSNGRSHDNHDWGE